MSKQQEILANLKFELNKITPIKDIIMFGSQVNGNAKNDSDIDILIISQMDVTWPLRKQIGDICSDLSIDYDALIDYKIITENDIKQKSIGMHPLIQDALNYGLYA